ncbi:uncharacterized protein LOC133200554 [Saccostrea echinata]|uniref:uncharacterized protein LOC133200554 n=1 Tax=Saccostrea echinata TaxID=191078 RepID=UPI002A7FC5B4|nr:uncharacterized protein LOC133200554 [Saccostrea echinata]
MDSPMGEKSIPNLSEFIFSSLKSVSDKPKQISKSKPFNDSNLHDKTTAETPNLSGVPLSCEPGPVRDENCSSLRMLSDKPTTEIIHSHCKTRYTNNDSRWEILLNLGSMKYTTGNGNSLKSSSGCCSAVDKIGRPDTPLQPRLLNVVSVNSKKSRSFLDKKAESNLSEGINERECNDCHTIPQKNYFTSRSIKSQPESSHEILTDEIPLHDCLSGAENFGLKSSSSVSQDTLSSQHSTREEYGWQGDCAHSRSKDPICAISTAATLSSTIYSNTRECLSTSSNDHRCVKACDGQFSKSEDSHETSFCNKTQHEHNATGGPAISKVLESSFNSGVSDYKVDYERDEDGTPVNCNNIPQHENQNQHQSYNYAVKKNVTKISSTEAKPVVTRLENIEKNTTHSKICEELQIPMVKEIKSGEQTEADLKQENIFSYRPRTKYPKSKERKKLKRKAESHNSLELRKAYDAKQRAETKKLDGLKLKKPENKMDIKHRKFILKELRDYKKGIPTENDKINCSGEVTNCRKKNLFVVDYTKENLAIYSSPGKTLFVKLESETNHYRNNSKNYDLEKIDQTRIILHQGENTSHVYEDDFESDEDDSPSKPGAELFDLRNSISLLDSKTANREAGRLIGNKNGYVEMARRLKASLGIGKELSAQTMVFNDDQTSCEQLQCATEAKTYAYSTNPGQSASYAGYMNLPPIEMNNFVVQRLPKHSYSQNKTGGLAKDVLLSGDKAMEISRRNLNQRYWFAQSEIKGIQKSPRSLSWVKKPTPKYDIDILETRARAPSFDTHMDCEFPGRFQSQ